MKGLTGGMHCSHCGLALLALIIFSTLTAAEDINGNGVSLNLPATDQFSGTAQSNNAGARLVAVGSPVIGVVSTNTSGAKLIIEPVNAIAGSQTNPQADFIADPLTGDAPLTVQFTDLSTGGLYTIQNWTWDFGDSTPNSFTQNPQHDYLIPGTYSVTLSLTTTGGPATLTRTNYITVTQGVPALSYWGGLALALLLGVIGCNYARKHMGLSFGRNIDGSY